MTQAPIETFKDGKPVICPACGGSICTHDPSSFALRPNNRFRGHLNGLIVDLRNFTRGLDANLSNAVTNLPLHDIYGTPYVREEILHLIERGLLENAAKKDLGIQDSARNLVDGGVFPDAYTAAFVAPQDANTSSHRSTVNLFKDAELQLLKQSLQAVKIESLMSPSGEYLRTYKQGGQAPPRPTAESEFGIPQVRLWAEYFERQVDPYDFSQAFAQLDTLPDRPDAVLSDDQLEKAVKLLLGVGLERRSNGLLLDVALEQQQLRHFMLHGHFQKAEAAIKEILKHLRPGLSRYFERIEASIQPRTTGAGGTSTDSERKEVESTEEVYVKIHDNLRRARLLLLMLHGHAYSCLPTADKEAIQTRYANVMTDDFHVLFLRHLWVVSERTEISPLLLSRMLNSKGFFRDSNLSLQTALHSEPVDEPAASGGILGELLQYLRKRFFSRFKKSTPTKNDEKVFQWHRHIEKLVTVHCSSDVKVRATVIQNSSADAATGWKSPFKKVADYLTMRKLWFIREKATANKKPARSDSNTAFEEENIYVPCDYAITSQNTYSIVILGSMGAGKTCAFNTGLARVWQLSEALKLDISPTDPDSLLKLERIRTRYQNGEIEDPTEFNVTVNLAVSELPDGQHPSRVSILDIPGETVFSLISGTGQDSELRRIMKSANAVVFLFDIWSDTVVSDNVKKCNDSAFKGALENKARTEEARSEKQGSSVDQRLLLQRLYSLLEEERTADQVRKIPFICLFPKADLLVTGDTKPTDRSKSPYILKEMFETLQEAGLLFTEGSSGGNTSGSLRSSAGINPEFEKLKELWTKFALTPALPEGAVWGSESDKFPSEMKQMIEYQQNVARLISKMFEGVLRTNVSNMLGETPAVADRTAFSARVNSGVIDFVQKRFDECYFLPVSALGKSPEVNKPAQGDQKSASSMFKALSTAPQSIFIEYAFLIPLMLAIKACLGPEQQSSEQQSTD